MTAGTMGVELDGLTVGYRGRRARWVPLLRDVHATARRGELTALVGPNGAGKSTLLRAVCGLAAPLGGSCRIDDREVAGLGVVDRARLLAVVLTEREAPALVRVHDLVALGRYPHTGLSGHLTAADHDQVDWALDTVGAAHLAGRRVGELSDGERQRAFTARALAQDPAVLVLDEPTAFLDASARVALLSLLARLARQRGMAVVVCTHDLELVLRVTDTVWLAAGGRIRAGTPEELALSGAIGEVFDSGDLVFDPASATFQPRAGTEQGAVAHVRGSEPHVAAAGRALSRAGWQVRRHADGSVADGAARPGLVVWAESTGYRSSHAGVQREHTSLGELGRWARELAEKGWDS